MLLKLFPHGTPKFIRIICYISLCFFTLVGLAMNASGFMIDAGAAFANILFFILLGFLLCLSAVGIWFALCWIMHRGMFQRLDALSLRTGFSPEMAQCVEAAIVLPTAGDRALFLFERVMAEQYPEAEREISRVPVGDLSAREEAMYNTAFMLCCVMTGKANKAHMLFSKCAQRQLVTYESHPEFDKVFHEYMDDAAIYYMLGAALHTHRGETAEAEDLLKRLSFQLSKHCEPDAHFLMRIARLNTLYAGRQMQAAFAEEAAIRQDAAAANLPQGQRRNYERMAEQARLYANYNQEGSAAMSERILPK